MYATLGQVNDIDEGRILNISLLVSPTPCGDNQEYLVLGGAMADKVFTEFAHFLKVPPESFGVPFTQHHVKGFCGSTDPHLLQQAIRNVEKLIDGRDTIVSMHFPYAKFVPASQTGTYAEGFGKAIQALTNKLFLKVRTQAAQVQQAGQIQQMQAVVEAQTGEPLVTQPLTTIEVTRDPMQAGAAGLPEGVKNLRTALPWVIGTGLVIFGLAMWRG